MTEQERQRVEQACFGSKPAPGSNPPSGGPSRGFFTNSAVGGLGTANNFMDPTMLAVIGILITLVATTMQMVRGN
jgi:hypothetical protein